MTFGFSPDGALLAAGGADGAIKLWITRTGQELHTLTGHRLIVACLAISPDGKTLASAGEDRTVKLWDIRTGQEVASLEEHSYTVSGLAFTPDGATLISVGIGDGGEICTWSAVSEDTDPSGQ